MKMERCYSLLEIKEVDEARGIITGIASTPTTDRMGDIVKPEGAVFKLPIPLLWQHDSWQPIGHVTQAKVTKSGIEIVAEIAKDLTPAIAECWKLIKAGLVRGLSIGFRGLDTEQIPNSWGIIFEKWEWLELSAVTIPANAEATIQSIKSIDQQLLAAHGTKAIAPVVRISPSASVMAPPKLVNPLEGKMKTIAEQIAAFEETRKAKATERQAIMSAAAEKGETLDAAQTEAYDGLTAELKSIDAHLGRLRDMEKEQVSTAKAVGEVKTVADAVEVRSGITVKAPPKLAPGIAFARVAKCLIQAGGIAHVAAQIAEAQYKDCPAVINHFKGAVPAGTTASGSWAGFLHGTETTAFADFVEYLRPKTILGRFGQNGIPALRSIPFDVPLISQLTGASAHWTGEAAGIGLTKITGARDTLTRLKIGAIIALSREIVNNSSPAAEALIRDDLAKGLQATLDSDFINPANNGSANVKPASVTYGAAAIASTGTDADAVRLDLRALFNKFDSANNPPDQGVLVMSMKNARALATMTNGLGQPEFPQMTMIGGSLLGVPVITSDYVGTAVALINASDIYLGDDGGVEISMSDQASLQMLDTGLSQFAGSTPAPSEVVSMFQTDSVAVKATRTINWKRRRTQSVAYLTSVVWGGAVPAS